MTDPHADRPIEERLDKEISLKAVWVFGVGILVLVAIAGALTWWISLAMRSSLESQDPPPPALVEARWAHEPPGPRLQPTPATEFDSYLAEQELTLSSYGWVDEASGIVRVPLERAVELALESGLAPAPAEPITEPEVEGE